MMLGFLIGFVSVTVFVAFLYLREVKRQIKKLEDKNGR